LLQAAEPTGCGDRRSAAAHAKGGERYDKFLEAFGHHLAKARSFSRRRRRIATTPGPHEEAPR
jgi:hypothetical protein